MRGKKSFTKLIVTLAATVILTSGSCKVAPYHVKAASPDLSGVNSMPVGDLSNVPEQETRETIDSDYSTESFNKNAGYISVDHGYYYGKLDNNIKKDLYDGMYIAADSSRRLAYGSKLPDAKSEEAVAEVAYNFYSGTTSRIDYYTGSSAACNETVNETVEALCYDHMSNVEYYMCAAEVYEFKSGNTYKDYVLMRAATSDNYERINSAIRTGAKNLANQIRSAGLVSASNPAKTVLNVHDYFINKVSFNYPVSYNTSKSGYYNNAHTAYGSLCEGSAVCDGYVQGYSLVLNELGIDSKIVTGIVSASGKKGGHAWAMVKIDGEWYEEDPTWDDTKDIVTHAFYNKTTEQYSNGINGYQHLRTHPYSGILIDKAYGTKYAYTGNIEETAEVRENNASLESQNGKISVGTIKEVNGIDYMISSGGGVIVKKISTVSSSKIVIPDSVTINGTDYPVTEISEGAFAGITKIKTVKLGKNIENIGKSAFERCKNLTTLDMSAAKVVRIGSNAAAGCKKLVSIKINGNSLKKIGSKAFGNADKKAKVVVYAKNKKAYNSAVKKLKASGLKTTAYKFKKKK